MRVASVLARSRRTVDRPVIIFAHIPKTAGQTVIRALRAAYDRSDFSPVRTHSQAPADAQLPPGYRLYAGHFDWVDLEKLPANRFAFTVLRDPRDRIASFYFYTRREAAKLSREALNSTARTNMRMALTLSADDYFFGGDRAWQRFVQDHYNNFYCSYFSTRKIRGWKDVAHLDAASLVSRALRGARRLQGIYSINRLGLLENHLAEMLGHRPNIANVYVNAGPHAHTAHRWQDLIDLFERDDSAARLDRFATSDARLMQHLRFAS